MSNLVLSEVFDGHTLNIVQFNEEPIVMARELAAALGYADTNAIARAVRQDWSADFIDGVDFRVLTGPALREFRELMVNLTTSSIDARSPSLLVLTESGLWMVAQKTGKELGVKLRRFLADKVLPKLARNEPILPAGYVAPPAAVTEAWTMREAVQAMHDAIKYAERNNDIKGALAINRQFPRVLSGRAMETRIPKSRAPSGQLSLPVADPIETAWGSLVEAWAAAGHPGTERKAGEIINYAPADLLATIGGKDARGRGMSFGHALARHNGNVYGGWKIARHGNGYKLAAVRS